MIKLRAILLVLTAVAALSVAYPARANYIVTLEQIGSNVVATGSGSINLTGLSAFLAGNQGPAFMNPIIGIISTGTTGFAAVVDYTGLSGPTSFGSGGATFASSGSGDRVAIAGIEQGLIVPQGYHSGNAPMDSSTYNNATFASLGVTPGTYEWTGGTGADADSFTLQIGAAGVPDGGSTVSLLGFASLGLAAVRRKLSW